MFDRTGRHKLFHAMPIRLLLMACLLMFAGALAYLLLGTLFHADEIFPLSASAMFVGSVTVAAVFALSWLAAIIVRRKWGSASRLLYLADAIPGSILFAFSEPLLFRLPVRGSWIEAAISFALFWLAYGACLAYMHRKMPGLITQSCARN